MTERLEREISVGEFIAGYTDIPLFDECCKKCKNYGKRWSCPPYGFDRMSVWEGYSSLLLRAEKLTLSEEETETVYPGSGLEAAYEAVLGPVKRRMTEELLRLESENPGSLALFPGCCEECPECSRINGMPCARPDRMRFSIESLGGDVLKILRDLFGEETEWAENGRLPRKLLLVGGMLRK